MSGYSSNLKVFASRLNGFSRTSLKVPVLNQSTAGPSNSIVVDIPTGGLIDLSTLTMWATVTTTCGATDTGFVTLPKHGLSGLITRMEVESSGGIISSISQNYSQIYTMMAQLQGFDSTPAANSVGSVLEGSQDVALPGGNLTGVQYAVKRWLGFVGSVKPDLFPTDLCPLRLRITLDNALALVIAGVVANPSFTLSNIFFTVDSVSIDDGLFNLARQKYVHGGGLLELPFTNYFQSTSFNTTMGFTHRWNASSRSLDRVYATLFPATYLTTQGARDGILYNSANFIRTATGVKEMNLSLNSVPATSFHPTPAMAFGLTQDALGLHSLHDEMPFGLNATTWVSKYFVWCVSYCNKQDPGERISSGLSTAGSQVVGSFECFEDGAGTPANYSWVLAECQSLLQIGANGFLNVIQ